MLIYQIVIVLALGGSPQAFVGTKEFSSLRECNHALMMVSVAIKSDWAATCEPAVKA